MSPVTGRYGLSERIYEQSSRDCGIGGYQLCPEEYCGTREHGHVEAGTIRETDLQESGG